MESNTRADANGVIWRLLHSNLLPITAALLIVNDEQFVYWTKERGGEQCKSLSPEDVQAAFALQSVDSGWLPPGVVRWGRSGGAEWLIKFIPAGRHMLTFHLPDQPPREVTLRLPPLLFAGREYSYHVWAVKKREFSPMAALFHAPLPNINDGGKICFGGNRLPLASPKTIDAAWRLFVQAPFNNTWVGGKSHRYPKNILDVLLSPEVTRRGYPLRDLVPVSGGVTIDRLVEEYLHRS